MYYEWKNDSMAEIQEAEFLRETARKVVTERITEELEKLTTYAELREWMRNHGYTVRDVRNSKNPVTIREILVERYVSAKLHGDVFADAEMLRKKYAKMGVI